MSPIAILVIIGAVALVFGPVMMMQPSKRDKHLVKLRTLASQLGLRVHLQPVPETVQLDEPESRSAMYCLPWQEQRHSKQSWLLTKRGYEHGLHFDGVWEWQGEGRELNQTQLKSALASVPDTVFAVARGPQGLCCYWSERGSEAQVELLADWLKGQLSLIVEQ